MNNHQLARVGLDRVGGISGVVNRALECLRMYYRPYGIHGALGLLSYRLFGWPEELVIQPAGIKHPVHLRIRTSDVSVCDEILLRGQYAIDLPIIPEVIVDAGANIGMASIYYAHRYPNVKIIALEPEASNFAMLVRNVEHYPNIHPLNAALWNKDGQIAVTATGPAPNRSCKVNFVVHEGEGVPVRALTMRTLMSDMQIRSVDLLKVDIEGAEKEVFESCDWMETVRCLVIELHDRFKPGCRAAVDSVTEDFSSWQRGEATVFLRKSYIASRIS